MTDDEIRARLNKSERYMAFLLTALPRLKTTALHADEEDCTLEKREVLRATLDLLPPGEDGGICLEFGVYKGKSLRLMGERLPRRRFYGFDSFEGFPEDDRPDWEKDFRVRKLPDVPENCTLVKGWFDETLPKFLSENEERIDFIDVDCDIYSSTSTVLGELHKHGRLRPGLIIYFDELINYATWPWHEMLALFEMLEETGFGIQWLCTHQKVRQIDDTLLMHRDGRYPRWRDAMRQGFQAPASLMLTEDGIDYGPLHLPHFEKRVRELGRLFDDMTTLFKAGRIRHDTEKPIHERLRLFVKHRILKRGI